MLENDLLLLLNLINTQLKEIKRYKLKKYQENLLRRNLPNFWQNNGFLIRKCILHDISIIS